MNYDAHRLVLCLALAIARRVFVLLAGLGTGVVFGWLAATLVYGVL